jgi:hypothetical protein
MQGRASSRRLLVKSLPLKMARGRRTQEKSSAFHVTSLDIMQVNVHIGRRGGNEAQPEVAATTKTQVSFAKSLNRQSSYLFPKLPWAPYQLMHG